MRKRLALSLLIPVVLFAAGACREESPAPPAQQPPAAAVPVEQWLRNWPEFRGPYGDGIAPAAGELPEPDRWSVLWKTPVEADGFSSPIVWGERIYLSGEPDRVLAFDRTDGRRLWDTSLGPAQMSEEFAPGDAGLAAPTPCTDGQQVYAFFGTGLLGCVDVDGNKRWARMLAGPNPKNHFGLAAGPRVHGGLLLQAVDLDPDDSGNEPVFHSFVIGVRTDSGEPVWRTSRPTWAAWATPLLIRAGTRGAQRDVLVTAGDPWIIAYSVADGAELWRAEGLRGDVASSPAAAEGVVYTASDRQGPVLAVRLGGQGDVTGSHVAWASDPNMPDTVSPLCDGQRYYHIADNASLVCLDAATGRELWSRNPGGAFQASPVLAGGRLYLCNVDGVLLVLNPADGAELGRLDLGEDVSASPAILDGRIYIRGHKHLFCLGAAR